MRECGIDRPKAFEIIKEKNNSLTRIAWHMTLNQMIMNLKIATLNLCLGLKNKKFMIEKMLYESKIDILCLQEVEVEHGFDVKLLSIRGYDFLMEKNSVKSRNGIYVSNSIHSTRKTDLEGINSHLVIIDIEGISDIKR